MSSSDEDEEVTFRYGTPLEPYEEDEVPSKRRADDQYALDEHGRRRFHGAFTGGFSAGYGNSVDTQEGWTPATFKSSRSERGKFKSAAPEDFMDEEDRSEFGIAPRRIQTHDDFVGRKRPHPTKRYHDGPIPGEPALEQLLRVVPETAAMRLLKAMGWRPGRRIGASSPKEKTYGCYVPPEFRQNQDSSDEETIDYETLFADEDIPQSKDNRFGIGYVPLSRHSVLGSMAGEYGKGDSVSHLRMKDKGKRVSIRGQAFGVGALEDEDEDVYARQDMSHYDFDLAGPARPRAEKRNEKSEGLEGFMKARLPPARAATYPPPALPRGYAPARAGFAATRFDKQDDKDDYIKKGLGRHDLSFEQRGAFLDEPSIPQPKRTETKEDLLAKITGRNVNFTSASENATSNDGTVKVGAETVKVSTESVKVSAETVNVNAETVKVNADRDSTVEYSSGERVFIPFANDPAKQDRYERFLRGEESAPCEGGVAGWEAARERAEFEQARKLYKPLTGILRDRFTSGVGKGASEPGASDAVSAARSGMYGALTRNVVEWRPESLLCKRMNVPDPFALRPEKDKSEKSKVSYSIFEYLEGSIHSKESFSKEQSQFSGSKSLSQKNTLQPPKEKTINVDNIIKNKPIEIPPPIEVPNKRMTVAELFLLEAEKDRVNNLKETGEIKQTIEKFDKMELYNSIFMSDSEDESPQNDDNSEDLVGKPVNVERNTSPPRGIFANIDFDKINARPSRNKSDFSFDTNNSQKDDISVDKSNKSDAKVINDLNVDAKTTGNTEVINNNLSIENNNADNFEYGPKIPDNLRKRLEETIEKQPNSNEYIPIHRENTQNLTEEFKPVYVNKKMRKQDVIEVDSSSSSDSWVDAKSKTDKKKKKKSKHKHKSKHKKRKKEK